MRNPWLILAKRIANIHHWDGVKKFSLPEVNLMDIRDECRSGSAYSERLKDMLRNGLEMPFGDCSFAIDITFSKPTERCTCVYSFSHEKETCWVLVGNRARMIEPNPDLAAERVELNIDGSVEFWVVAAVTWQIAKMMVRTTVTNTYIMEHREREIAPSLRSMYSYYILRIEPRKERTEGLAPAGWEHFRHWHNRFHEVRGHYRTLRDGRLTFVKPHHRGDKEIGIIEKDYKVTSL